ncbi:MAG: CvpA family protein, partial [Oscillospiraceae bacterium]
YTATFPLLLNIGGQPTYFLALKDAAGLVKQYAMVNVQQYQVVATGNSLAECSQKYAELLKEKGVVVTVAKPDDGKGESQEKTLSVTGAITDIKTAVVDGNSIYYIRLQNSQNYFSVKPSVNEIVAVLNVGDSITVKYKESEKKIVTATGIELS